jgi:tRNA(Arg) A34 adenosine deaminase TadA
MILAHLMIKGNMMNKKFMFEAIELAHIALQESAGGPFGAIIVNQDNVVVGRGYNRVLATNDPTAHAEVTAIRDACRQLNSFSLAGCTIYTNCEPCPMCLGAIYWSRIEKIYYGVNREDAAAIGFDDNFFYQEINKSALERKVPMIAMLRDNAMTPFTEWENTQNKIRY